MWAIARLFVSFGLRAFWHPTEFFVGMCMIDNVTDYYIYLNVYEHVYIV